jgi:Fic family protein
VDEIADIIQPPVPRRTLQRRLAELVRAGYLLRRGRGKAARYVFATAPAGLPVDLEPAGLTLSSTSEMLRQLIRQPLTLRPLVGYQRPFLDGYRPNRTAYLSDAVRQHLRAVGRVADTPQPAGTYARRILDRLLIDLSWNSSRLEGNTYSLLETERLLAQGHSAEGKHAFETQMILNHKAAIEFLVESASDIGFNRYTVLNLHALLADNLLPDPAAVGRLRAIPVRIGQTSFHPLEVPQLIDECFQQVLDTADAIGDPFEQAFFAMVQLPYLQPFEDVNKRVSRLAANIPFIRHNLCPLSFIDVPEQAYVDALLAVYELNRVELLVDVFAWAYERSAARYAAVRQSLGEPDAFRLRYRAEIHEAVGEVVRSALDKTGATRAVKQRAQAHIPPDDQARFIEVVEAELLSL